MAPYSFAVLTAKPSTPTNLSYHRRSLLQCVLPDSASRILPYFSIDSLYSYACITGPLGTQNSMPEER